MHPHNNKTYSTLADLIDDAYEKLAHDARACDKATIMALLTRGQTESVYWTMAVGIILAAGTAGVIYAKNEKEHREFKQEAETFKRKRRPSPEEKAAFEELKRDCEMHLWQGLGETSLCLLFATACDVFQVLAIISLQHCWHEDLLGLYWPLWTLLGLGSTVAMIGVVVNQLYGLLEHELPPFSVGMGTPVLVVAAIVHLLWSMASKKIEELRSRKSDRDSEKGALKQAETQESTGSAACESITLSLEDGPILQIWESGRDHPPNTSVVGETSTGFIILEHKCQSENGPALCNTCSRRSRRRSATEAEPSPEPSSPSQNQAVPTEKS